MDERVYMVTGAAGFLGGTIVRQLVNEGKKVRVFVLKGDPAVKYIPDEVEIVEGDLTDIESLEPLAAALVPFPKHPWEHPPQKLTISMIPRSWVGIASPRQWPPKRCLMPYIIVVSMLASYNPAASWVLATMP